MKHASWKHKLGPDYFVCYLVNGSFAINLIGIEPLIA